MIEKKFVEAKKQEVEIDEYLKGKLGKGKISEVKIERTPLGEKIVIVTARPGLVIGRGGETIQEICNMLRKKFKLENPQVEVSEIQEPIFDAQTVADQIALSLERFGPLSFKLIAYRELDRIAKAGALGAEIRLSGRLPSERAKSWRFAFGYLKKTGASESIVRKAQAKAFTKPGVVGVKVSIVPPSAKIPDKIIINKDVTTEEIKNKIEEEERAIKEEEEKEGRKKVKKKKKIEVKKEEKRDEVKEGKEK